MNSTLILLILALGILTVLQRVLPWVLYKRFKPGKDSQRIFDLVAVSAFSSLMVFNMSSFSYQNVLPLIPALIVVYKTKNLGISVLVGMIFAFILTVI